MLVRLQRVKRWQTFTRTCSKVFDFMLQDQPRYELPLVRYSSKHEDSTPHASKILDLNMPDSSLVAQHRQQPHYIDTVYNDSSTLDPLSDASHVDPEFIESIVPGWKNSYNIAAYVNKSKTLQTFLSMGVSLFDIESISRKNAIYFLSLDFDRDCAGHVKFLVDNGLKTSKLGWFFSENPVIFKESLDALQERIDYLKSKRFTRSMIAQMLNRSASIWSYNTKTIDHKLGIIQMEFQLPAEYLRKMVTKQPTSLLLPQGQLYIVRFSFRQEYGFDKDQLHQLILNEPSILESERSEMFHRFDLIHREMELDLDTLVKFSKLFTCPIMDVRWRYRYLEKLKRAQFDPSLPLYVPPSAFYDCDDDIFCKKYAKTTIEDYKLFLKSV